MLTIIELLPYLLIDVIAAFALGINVSWFIELNYNPYYGVKWR